MRLTALRAAISKNRLFYFVSGAIVMSVCLVAVSMHLYYASGAFRLDLSRPEYESVRPQIEQASKSQRLFDNQGQLDVKATEEFLRLYNKEATKTRDANAFGNDVLSDEQLNIRPTDILPPQS